MTYEVICESLSSSFIKNLHKKTYKGFNLKKSSLIREIKYSNEGTLFCLYYIIDNGKKLKFIRFTSKNKNFSKIYSFDLCDSKMRPTNGFILKEDVTEEAIIRCINLLGNQKFLLGSVKKELGSLNPKKAEKEIKKLLNNNNVKESTILNEIVIDSFFVTQMVTMIMYGLLLIGLIYYYVKKIKNWQEEQQATIAAEVDINNSLFKGQTKNEKGFEIYNELTSFFNNVIDGNITACIVCGPPGVSKTYNLRRTLYFSGKKPGKDYIIEKGATLELIDIYSMLYNYRNGILVLDDFDSPLQDKNTINFLKSITDTYKRRIISMPRASTMSSGQGGSDDYTVPRKFEFKGKLIMITNLKESDIDVALRSRAPTITFNPSTKQIFDALQNLYKFVHPTAPLEVKEEVLEFINRLYKRNPNINLTFRSFQNCIDIKLVYPDNWKPLCQKILT